MERRQGGPGWTCPDLGSGPEGVLPGRPPRQAADHVQESRRRLHPGHVHRQSLPGRGRMGPSGTPPRWHDGQAGGAAPGAGRPEPGRQGPAACPGARQAGKLLAPGLVLRRQEGSLLHEAGQREVVPPLRDQHGWHWPAAVDQERLRRPGPHLPAQRQDHLRQYPLQYVHPVHAVHLLLHPGPLRRRRTQRIRDQPKQRMRLGPGAAQ